MKQRKMFSSLVAVPTAQHDRAWAGERDRWSGCHTGGNARGDQGPLGCSKRAVVASVSPSANRHSKPRTLDSKTVDSSFESASDHCGGLAL